MFKPINGWTKEKILDVIRARKHEKPAYCDDAMQCMYLTKDENKCAAGLFIPDGHEAQKSRNNIVAIMEKYTDIANIMPLNADPMRDLQLVHDNEASEFYRKFGGNAKEAMIDWVEKNVKG